MKKVFTLYFKFKCNILNLNLNDPEYICEMVTVMTMTMMTKNVVMSFVREKYDQI